MADAAAAAAAAAAAFLIPPPQTSVINLAIIELIIYSLSLPLALYITWKHGKKGMTAWPLFVSFLGMRIVSDAYQITNRAQPNIPNVVIIITNAGSVTCLQLTLIGMVYEA
jgi:tryptophan-rich sensory protein